jgi:hypothetical protein
MGSGPVLSEKEEIDVGLGSEAVGIVDERLELVFWYDYL